MAENDRLEFDVACALGMLPDKSRLAFPLPPKRTIGAIAKEILDECVDPTSYTESGCQVRSDFNLERKYFLEIGADTLCLAPGGRIIAGGSGVTVQLLDKALSRHFAFKVPRLSVLAYLAPDFENLDQENIRKRVDLEYNAFENERLLSRKLSHENIAQHIYGSWKEIPATPSGHVPKLPFSVSEWIDGATPLSEYLSENDLHPFEILHLIQQSFTAVDHIHRRRVMHWDIKADNLLVSSDGRIKLIDFGNSKDLDKLSEDRDLTATTTAGKFPKHSLLKPMRTDSDESRRYRLKLPHLSWNDPYIDLWMLGQEWNRCLKLSTGFLEGLSDLGRSDLKALFIKTRSHTSSRASDIWECLDIIFSRLLHSLSKDHKNSHIGADKSFDSTLLYYRESGEHQTAASQVLVELARIEPVLGAGQYVPELLVSLGEIVRLPVTGNSVFTERVSMLVDSAIARPTTLHLQLAQVREVFPGATHTRFEHLLGTVTTAAYFLRSLYLNELNAFWRVSAGEADIRAALVGAILHDVGHMAFGHFIEEMQDLMAGSGHVDYIRAVLAEGRRYVDWAADDNATPFTPAATRLDLEVSEIVDLVDILRTHWCRETSHHDDEPADIGDLLARVSSIFSDRPDCGPDAYLSRTGTRLAIEAVVKSVVDGPLDADKLDYLRRDSLHAGVMFANGIDIERFFESLRICVHTEPGQGAWNPAIGVSEKGLAAVETIITARYHLYSVVYWHRTVRCITAILQRVLSEIRMSLSDEAWAQFHREFLHSFRRLDDRQALEWLRKKLSKLKLLNRRIRDAMDPVVAHEQLPFVTFSDFLKALMGDRHEYFNLAFELTYVGPIGDMRGKTPRERLHDRICRSFNFIPTQEPLDSRATRESSQTLRQKLEKEFSAEITRITGSDFEIDTILIDVPESGKDQITGLYVDRRNKRRTRSSPEIDRNDDLPTFVDVTVVSPIAASLVNVFGRWARKVRIFMSRADSRRLHKLGFEAGDVAAVWENVLYATFEVDPNQPDLGLIEAL
jgi:HD superfamily phosphohydrolase/serine/threonine protein kinase